MKAIFKVGWVRFGLAGIMAILLFGCGSAGGEAESAIGWVRSFEAGLEKAKAEKKPMLVDFYADWCGPCKMMDKKTFPDEGVVAELENWVPVKIDVDKNQELAQKYKVQGIPTMIAFDQNGEMVGMKVGFLSPEQLLSFAKAARNRVGVSQVQTNL